jgi:hypothetical protein
MCRFRRGIYIAGKNGAMGLVPGSTIALQHSTAFMDTIE